MGFTTYFEMVMLFNINYAIFYIKHLLKFINLIVVFLLLSSCNRGVEKSVNNVNKINKLTHKEEIIMNNDVEINNKFKSISLFEDRFKLKIPYFFNLMDESAIALKYQRGNKPTVVYVNENGSANFAINYTNNVTSIGDLPKVMELISSKIQSVPDVRWMSKNIQKINGLDYIIMEFNTPDIGSERLYNYMFITALNKRLIINSFNCKMNEFKNFGGLGKEILLTLKIK